MAAEKLKVLSGKDVGTKSWADKMRKSAKEVAGRMETGYMDLAKILYDLFDVPVDGDPENGPWYKEWGYKTIGDFAETELNLQRRKAEYLRGIYYQLEVEMADMDPTVKKRIIALGWSKVRELIKILTNKNAAKWVELAEGSNYPDLCASIAKYKEKLEAAHALKDKGEKYVAPVPIKVSKKKLNEEEGDLPTAFASFQPPANDTEAPKILSTAVMPGSHGSPKPLPEATVDAEPELDPVKVLISDGEKFYPRNFAFPADLRDIVDAALKRAAELSNSSSPSHNMGIICQDFLATNPFGKPDQDQVLRFLAKFEKLLNVRLVVIDEDDDPIYGMSHLEELSKKLGVDL